MRHVAPARRFETILLDGYNPATWLREHVAVSKGYKVTQSAYEHPLWSHLKERSPPFPERDAWSAKQLMLRGIVRIEPGDEEHGIELGLIADERDSALDRAPELDLRSSRFMSLDGILLLLLLYRDAQDMGHRNQAATLRSALYSLGFAWAQHHEYSGETLDTWRFLLESRMVEWMPRFHPSQAAIRRAEEELQCELSHLAGTTKTKPRTPPRQLKGGRGERRWRRRVIMRACCLHYDGVLSSPNFEYRDVTPLYEWLTVHRTQIARHRSHAIDVLMLDAQEVATPSPDPLVMPAALYSMRRRPAMSESEWIVFGNQSIFDVIPVESE